MKKAPKLTNVSIAPEILAVVRTPALPVIWFDDQPAVKRGRVSRIRPDDLAAAFVAACQHIRRLEAELVARHSARSKFF